MAFRGSLTRTLMSTARSSSFRSTPRLRPPPSPSAPRLLPRRLNFTNPRTLGELGAAQSLMPMLAGVGLTSHIAVNLRAYSELSHGKRIILNRSHLGSGVWLGKKGRTKAGVERFGAMTSDFHGSSNEAVLAGTAQIAAARKGYEMTQVPLP